MHLGAVFVIVIVIVFVISHLSSFIFHLSSFISLRECVY